jgi:hypothetical protein
VTLAPEALTGLLARWGMAPDAVLPTERGTNNRTFAVPEPVPAGVLDGPDWARRTAALRGHASARRSSVT